jgi:hypothetical protein
MFARRPRYDDTFGVRMDLGADRIDPMSLRPSGSSGQLRVKPPVIVEQPRSLFDLFTGRSKDPFSELRERPRLQTPERRAPETRPARPSLQQEQQGEPSALEGGIRMLWGRLSVSQRIGICFVAGWFLLASGLFVPVIVIAVIYFSLRRRKA